jgi:hypothetical protein
VISPDNRSNPCCHDVRVQSAFTTIICFVFCLIISVPMLQAAETGAITGTLVDKVSGKPVVGAAIELDVPSQTTISNEQGQFNFFAVAPGEHNLRILDGEHVQFFSTVMVDAGTPVSLRYALDPLGQQEEEEVVIRSRRLQEEVSDKVLQLDEVKKIPGARGDIGSIIQSLPGVGRSIAVVGSGLGTGLVILGAAPEDSKVLIDGHQVPMLYHFYEVTSVLNADMLQRIDFLPAGFSSEFGEAIGGIVDVSTKPCTKKGIGGYVNASLIDAGFFLEGSLGNDVGFFAAARRSTVDLWLGAVLPKMNGVALTVLPVYYDYQVKVEWHPSPKNRLSLFAYGSSDEMKLAIQRAFTADPSLRGEFLNATQFHRLQLGWDYSPQTSWQVRASLVAGWEGYNYKLGDERWVKISAPSLRGRFDTEWQPLERLRLVIGGNIAVLYFDLSHRFPRPPKEGEFPINFETWEVHEGKEYTSGMAGALYVSAGFKPWKNGLLTAGVRAETYESLSIGRFAIMPRISFKQELRPGTTFSAAFGIYYQPPGYDEMSKSYGTPTLNMERAWHYLIRLQQELPWSLSFDFDVFYKTLDQLVVPVTTSTAQKIVYANSGIGKISGFELMIRRALRDGLFGWLSYTMMRSERKDGPDKPWRLFDFDQTHILTLVAGYRLPTGPVQPSHGQNSGWEFGLRFQLVSGNPTTFMHGGSYDADYDIYIPTPGAINAERLPTYHRLDVRVDYTWAFRRWALSVYVDVQNVYNHRSIEGVVYNYDYTLRSYYEWLPIIPSLGITGWF